MKVRDYLDLFAALRGCSDWSHPARLLGLNDVLERRIGALSQGFRRRVSLAAAVACEPSLIVLDEPLANIDPTSRIKISELLASLGEETTLLMTTHILPKGLRARIIVMDGGTIVATIEAKALSSITLQCDNRTVETQDAGEATRLVSEGCKISQVKCLDLDDLLREQGKASHEGALEMQ